ncbi:MAG: thioredoxin [Bacteroidales bacterium]
MQTTLIILGVLVVFAGYLFFNYRRMKNIKAGPDNPRIKILDDKNFAHQINKGISIVDFWASWCMPCKMMIPVLNEVAEEVGDSVTVCKVNIEQYQSVAQKYNVRNIPTMLIFKNGKEVDRVVGVKTKNFLLTRLNMLKYK